MNLIRLEDVTPEDFPPAPWVLKDSTGRWTTHPMGGPYAVVNDTALWLRGLRMDVSKGPNGPRAKGNGGLYDDLRCMDFILKRKAATEGRLFLCVAENCGALIETVELVKPDRCPCGAEMGDKAGWRAERWAGVTGPHTKTMNNVTRKYGF